MMVRLLGRSVEVALHLYPGASHTILMLHEALGSVPYWKDFPEKLALATGANVLLYSRAGHGSSEGPIPARTPESYLREVNETIPALLEHFRVDSPIVYGHSEGAGLAILYAALSQKVSALILESPFVIPQDSSRRHIKSMEAAYHGSHLQQRLTQYHQNPDEVFFAWTSGVGAFKEGESPFADYLPRISCPILVLQGENDAFGSRRHLEAILAVLPETQHESFANTGHLPHREQTEGILARVRLFLASISNKMSPPSEKSM
jgi:pimeloyl-ACP methyl ester carboxylesterase